MQSQTVNASGGMNRPEKCPVCGVFFDDTPEKTYSHDDKHTGTSSDLSKHIYGKHGPGGLTGCFCGWKAAEGVKHHCDQLGGYEAHYMDFLMGVKQCNLKP